MGWMLQPKEKNWLNGYKKQDPYVCCLQEIHLKPRDTYRLKLKGWKKIIIDKYDPIAIYFVVSGFSL